MPDDRPPSLLAPPPPPPRLLDQVRAALRVQHYSRRTEEAYVHWIRAFILFPAKRHPRDMGPSEVNAFLGHLAQERHVSASIQYQAPCALLFLHEKVLGRALEELEGLVRARRPSASQASRSAQLVT